MFGDPFETVLTRNQTMIPQWFSNSTPLIQQDGLKQGAEVVIEFETGSVHIKSTPLPAALIEQNVLRLTLKHLGDGVTVKAIPHPLGWQVQLYGIGMENPLGHLMYGANGELLSDVDKVLERIFATIGT